MNILVIIGVVVAIIGIVLIIIINQYNKFQWTNVLILKGEKNLQQAFSNKHDILIRYIDILKENKIDISDDEYDEYKLLNTKQSVDKINKKINEINNYINKIMDNNEKLLKNESIININKELNEVNITINGGKKYYNDNLIIYNHLVNAFPSNIIAKVKHYKGKEFLDSDTKEELKILEN